MERISSRQNPLVRRFRSAAAGAPEDVLLEGAHLLQEALGSGLPIDTVAMTDRAAATSARDLAARAATLGARIVQVSDTVMAAMSPVRQPSGVVAIARRGAASLDEALATAPQLVLMLADVQDPGNVGAIVRVADACGATGIVASERTADPLAWKALRGSMGSVFRLPAAHGYSIGRACAEARRRGVRIYAAVPRGGTLLPRCTLDVAVAVMLGGEGAGLPPELVALADETLTIPMRNTVESLNVATAAALVVYEAWRQREPRAMDDRRATSPPNAGTVRSGGRP